MIGTRQRLAHAIALVALLAAEGAPDRAAASDMQRMLLAPAACRALAPGATAEASAYCLDQSRRPPVEGAILASVPAAFDQARVEIAGARPMSLSQALARHLIEIEGGGSDRLLRLRNNGAEAVEICIDGPTVVMGNGEAAARDIAAVSDTISRLVGEAGETGEAGDAHAHADTQRKLWEAVNAAQAAERQQAAAGLLAPAPSRAPTGASGSSRATCARGTETADVKLCVQ